MSNVLVYIPKRYPGAEKFTAIRVQLRVLGIPTEYIQHATLTYAGFLDRLGAAHLPGTYLHEVLYQHGLCVEKLFFAGEYRILRRNNP